MLRSIILMFLMLSLFLSCQKDNATSKAVVVLPSITHDMRINVNLTYSAFVVLSETSAYLGRLNEDFVVSPMVLESYVQKENFFTINLNKEFRSWRGEDISANDLIFSIKYYLRKQPALSFALNNIVGSESCIKNEGCNNLKIIKRSKYKVEIYLKKNMPNFVEKLMNPWFVIFKEGKPFYEKIGDCFIPYQTGKSHLIACGKDEIIINMKGKKVFVSRVQKSKPFVNFSLVNDNPSDDFLPSLTVMSIFANPKSGIQKNIRVDILKRIRDSASKLANVLKLKHSPLMVSSWIKLNLETHKTLTPESKFRCQKEGVRILLDTSLPSLTKIKKHLTNIFDCKINFQVTNADKFFDNFAKNDFGIAWFTPDELEIYNFYSSLDCNKGGNCYFNWEDDELNYLIRKIQKLDTAKETKSNILKIEEHILENGYVAPIAELTWWISSSKGKTKPIHPLGLAQIKLSDFIF